MPKHITSTRIGIAEWPYDQLFRLPIPTFKKLFKVATFLQFSQKFGK